jgi:hypothetical protein
MEFLASFFRITNRVFPEEKPVPEQFKMHKELVTDSRIYLTFTQSRTFKTTVSGVEGLSHKVTKTSTNEAGEQVVHNSEWRDRMNSVTKTPEMDAFYTELAEYWNDHYFIRLSTYVYGAIRPDMFGKDIEVEPYIVQKRRDHLGLPDEIALAWRKVLIKEI